MNSGLKTQNSRLAAHDSRGTERLISVAVPVPLLDLLTYRLPPGLDRPPPGARVVVPLGTRTVTGCVIGTDTPAGEASGRTIKPVLEILDSDPYLPADILALALWVAEYYVCGAGDAIAAALPPRAWAARRRADFKTVRMATLVRPAGGEDRRPPGRKQRAALELLGRTSEGLDVADLEARGIDGTTLARLARRGLITLTRRAIERDPFPAWVPGEGNAAAAPLHLTGEQAAALDRLTRLAAGGSFHAALLHGVTGSGKTELYLRLADAVRRTGRGVLVLVPEIALTPALAVHFRQAFGARVAILHSGLSDGERHDQWHRIRRGDTDIVIGTRSAVFAPLPRLGLVIVDEEHDASYKQEETPRYHGRDLAVLRAQRAGALAVLGSATPSLETFHNAARGRYEPIVLTRRVLDRPLAAVEVVDMRAEYAARGPDAVLSGRLAGELQACAARGDQALVLLNRRGFAVAVFCRQCGSTLECPNCSVSLTVHRAARRARCHYCNYAIPVPHACRQCGGAYLELSGFGTERVHDEVSALLPSARVERLDRDTARRRGAAGALLARFARGDLDVLVGTQMIAKGHDFPRVTLVGVISADVGLGLADFRAAERTFQLLTQVAGRAGRGTQAGLAIVQTLYPRHYSIRHACEQDYQAFYDAEMRFRTAMRYPPAVALINVVVRARSLERAIADATGLIRQVRRTGGSFRALGPAPAPMAKLKGEHRAQFFLKGTQRTAMRRALAAVLTADPDLRRRVTIDVDPVSML